MSGTGIVMVGVHHRTQGIAILERVRAAAENGSPAAAVAMGARGAVGVVTCHRVELYLEGVEPGTAGTCFGAWCEGGVDGVEPVVLRDEAAARHLLRVAAGLEAAVLGDDQVLGQLRRAYAAACRGLLGGPLLHRLFHAAFRTGKRVRSETALGRGGRSVAGEAVALIARRLGGLRNRRVLVLGAGEMARIVVTRLARRGAGPVLVANRSIERARALAAEVGGRVVPWSWRARAAASVDALVVATGAAGPVLSEAELAGAVAGGRQLVAADLSMPRNLPSAARGLPGFELVDLEGLAAALEQDAVRRRDAVAAAEAIVEEELDRWQAWVRSREAAAPGRRGGVAVGRGG